MKKRKTRARAVIAVQPDGSETAYISVSQAAMETSGQAARISAACQTGIPYRGILWRYADEEGSVW
mgnify:CR=1 FL=1